MEVYTRCEEFSHYMERLEFFFTANGIEDTPENAGRTKAILVSVIGSKTYGLFSDLLVPNRPTDKSHSEIAEFLKNHFQPKFSEVVQWYKFYVADRQVSNLNPIMKTVMTYLIVAIKELIFGVRSFNVRRKQVRTGTAIFMFIDHVGPACFANYKKRA